MQPPSRAERDRNGARLRLRSSTAIPSDIAFARTMYRLGFPVISRVRMNKKSINAETAAKARENTWDAFDSVAKEPRASGYRVGEKWSSYLCVSAGFPRLFPNCVADLSRMAPCDTPDSTRALELSGGSSQIRNSDHSWLFLAKDL